MSDSETETTPTTRPTQIEIFEKRRQNDLEKSNALLKRQASVSESTSNAEDSDPTKNCQICTEPIEIFAIGKCDHPICHKCSIRLRVKMNNDNCPICRLEMEDVFLDTELRPYANCSRRLYKYDKKFRVLLPKSPDLHREIEFNLKELLAFNCTREECLTSQKDRNGNEYKAPLRLGSFQKWNNHMYHTHQVSPCDLCVKHQDNFCSEIVLYTKTERARHKKDVHPVCEFCDIRFYDNDALIKHLRRDHEYCRLCENVSMGASLIYYEKFKDLKRHLVAEHHYCQHDSCNMNDREYSAFKTELELEIHYKEAHGGQKKASVNLAGSSEVALPPEQRTARSYYVNQDDADFRNPRNQPRKSRHAHDNSRSKKTKSSNNQNDPSQYPEAADPDVIPTELNRALETTYEAQIEDFPSLSGEPGAPAVSKPVDFGKNKVYNPMDANNFPTLGLPPPQNEGVKMGKKSSGPHMKKQQNQHVPPPQPKAIKSITKNDNFPSLPAGQPKRQKKVQEPKRQPIQVPAPVAVQNQASSSAAPKSSPGPGPSTLLPAPTSSKDNFPSLGGSKSGPSSLAKTMKKNPKSMLASSVMPRHIQDRNSGKGPTTTKLVTTAPNQSQKAGNKKSKKAKNADFEDDWWEDKHENPLTYVKNYNQSASNSGSGGGLVNGAHPLAPKIAKPEAKLDVRELNQPKKNMAPIGKKSDGEFPTLGGPGIGPYSSGGNLSKLKGVQLKKPKPAPQAARAAKSKAPAANVITPAEHWKAPKKQDSVEKKSLDDNNNNRFDLDDFGPGLQKSGGGKSSLSKVFKSNAQMVKKSKKQSFQLNTY